jgi:hypothetical protein
MLMTGAALAAALPLCACGGGSGGGVASIPPPPPSPTPAPPPATTPEGANTSLNIIDNAPTGEFALAGAVVGWSAPLAAAEQPQMRYDAASDTYEVQFPGTGWQTLWTKDTSLPDWARQVGIGADGQGGMSLNLDRRPNGPDDYPYSSIGFYGDTVHGTNGFVAFGVATPADAVPTSGSAQYNGVIDGLSDIYVYVPGAGPDPWPTPLGVSGTVTLSFNFSNGTLGGSMKPVLSSGESLGSFTFTNSVYSAGAYSGEFNSSASGANGFYGQLTGPNGEELIGAWALPFHYSGDGQDHEAVGAWVAKQ